MNLKVKPQDLSNNHKGLEMYFSSEIAEKFAELQQNEKNFKVAQIIDTILIQESSDLKVPIYSAELGGGAHPDRYDKFFSKLINEGGHIDWVDIAPPMLKLAKKYISNEKYQNRKNVITFIKSEILEYLRSLENEKLDLAIMKYTINDIKNLDELFRLLSVKLAQGGKFIATIGNAGPELKSYSTNARFLYNGKQFPDNETRTLKDGDNFTVKFFKVSGDPTAGYLEGAETLKYYHSAERIKRLADYFRFNIFLGDWKDFVPQENQKSETMNQEVLVLTKNKKQQMIKTFIHSYCINVLGYPEKIAEQQYEELAGHNDILNKFIDCLKTGKYDDTIKIEGYTAKKIHERFGFLSPIGVYNYLIYLREKPKEALDNIAKGLPRK